jgi:hypothetical protein
MLTSEISKKTPTLTQDRKVSVPISMPSSLLEEIDKSRGDVPRSVFVCKVLRARADMKNTGGLKANAAND